MMWQLDNRELGSYRTPGHPIRFSKTPAQREQPGRRRSASTARRCSREVGYSADEIASLKRAGIVR